MENIRYGDPDANDKELFQATRKANIHDCILTVENGYTSLVGKTRLKLSRGQRQRIACKMYIKKCSNINLR